MTPEIEPPSLPRPFGGAAPTMLCPPGPRPMLFWGPAPHLTKGDKMRAEPWMDSEPPKFDPLKEARRIVSYWADRCREHQNGLVEARREWAAAVEKVARLQDRPASDQG